MRMTVDKYIQLTFYAVLAYLILVHSRGGVKLVRSIGGVNIGVIEALQGRSRVGDRNRG